MSDNFSKDFSQNIDAVFEGGGVKGSGLVGAVAIAEELGYKFVNVAGTSAGAIIAALIAAGYSAAELKATMDTLDYKRFKDEGVLGVVPFLGSALYLLFKKGIYKGDFLHAWISELLAKKGITTFADLIIDEFKDDPKFRYRLQVVASDVTRGRLLVLPGDSVDFGIDPDTLPVADAIRMSMSIPYFYRPARLKTKKGDTAYIVDGAVLSNYPLSVLDDNGDDPDWPTIGFKLVDPDEDRPHRIRGPISLFAALFSTMMEAHDARYIKDADFMRTVPIPALGVRTTDFGISAQKKQALYESGTAAARDFFTKWNFEEYKAAQRAKASVQRRDRVWSEK